MSVDATPHIHDLQVYDRETNWRIIYGDQDVTVRKPLFRSEKSVLNDAIKKVIRKHDHASISAGQTAAAVENAVKSIRLESGKWGSEQL